MRKSFKDVLAWILYPGSGPRRGPLRILRLGLKAASARIPAGLCPPLQPPLLATLSVTERCNLDCPFCKTHGTGRGEANDIDRILRLVTETASLGAEAVGFTGGEPLLVPGLERALSLAAGLGLFVHLNTNGTLIDDRRAAALAQSGVSSVNVSLDGASPLIHDRLRGKGSFSRALKGIGCLTAARDRSAKALRLRLVMTLGEENAGEALDLLELGARLGVDGCSFIPLHVFPAEQDRPGSKKRPRSRRAARAAAELADRSGEGIVDNSRAYLLGMRAFFLGAPMPGRCSAPRTSILVGPGNLVYPCVPVFSARPGRGIPLDKKSLGELFKSGVLADTLNPGLCRSCWWNCHRETDIALGIL